ncbi:metal ABC transporter ATP-binding protein [Saccharospirillum alexandrii]|uniref:ATP-binding cassette domain-containing protein n=1 Tax=Saccharospirillum alexandrii TaxID=2448477 RepID=UPI001C70254C|nr:metal ABC transporter ATP-binding protein [Saccharospirillum alexandrii]
MPRTQPLIEARQLGVRLGGETIIRNVNLSVFDGQIVTLIGPNGAGKSTLIKTLLGVHRVSEGQLTLAPSLTIGYMPQRISIDDSLPLSVYRLMTLTHRAARTAVIDALRLTDVPHLIDRPVQQLSGGEFQRVMLARALLKQPDVLVLDEPVQGVDFNGEVDLYRLIQRIRDERGCAILMVSHDLHLVMAATDEVVCLNGHVCCTGAPETITRQPEFTQLFGHKHADALAFYSHHHDHNHSLAEQGGHVHD